MRSVTVEKKYLAFPANPNMSLKKVTFCLNGQPVYALDMPLDRLHPTFWAYADVQRFCGQTLEITVQPETEFEIRPCDEIPEDDDPFRPRLHFTVRNGWNNDPNGLIFLNGVYHLFFQYNPCSTKWGNMHWGHATSADLLHWQETDIALFPDAFGTMFSGSAVLDAKNVSGLGTAEQPPVLLFYTAAGEALCQCLAYSTDGLKTVKKYEGNPVVSHIEGANRDPKVVWCEELNRWVMALYLDGDRYALLTSENLLHWTKMQEISLQEDNECPDFFPINDEEGTRKWVFMGAHDVYLIGSVTGQGFAAEQAPQKLNRRTTYYAAQTFSNLPEGRVLRIGWETSNAPCARFSQQMSIPMSVTLHHDADGIYRLALLPAEELENAISAVFKRIRVAVSPTEPYIRPLPIGPQDITVCFDDAPAAYTLSLFGREIRVDTEKNEVQCEGHSMPLSVSGGEKSLRIVSDTCSTELFADGGRCCLVGTALQDDNVPFFRIQADRPTVLQTVSGRTLGQTERMK